MGNSGDDHMILFTKDHIKWKCIGRISWKVGYCFIFLLIYFLFFLFFWIRYKKIYLSNIPLLRKMVGLKLYTFIYSKRNYWMCIPLVLLNSGWNTVKAAQLWSLLIEWYLDPAPLSNVLMGSSYTYCRLMQYLESYPFKTFVCEHATIR